MTDTVSVRQGRLRGRADRGVMAFLGVPYAAPPFGADRMRPPRAPQPWEGLREAGSYGPTCPKGDYPPQYAPLFPEVVIPGTDCLNLNIWTPDPGGSGLPVLVWLHGGSFMNGSGSVAEYRGTAFARDGVVCVTINYRLGAEGFLHTPDGVSNVGLLDQLAALTWVHDNIAAFGGDPSKVTVAGESAGAMSVTTLLSMPDAAGLFHRAIAQSGAGHHTMAPAQGAMVARFLADALGVEPTRDAVAALPVEQVTRAAEALTAEVQTAPDPAKWGELSLSLLPFMPTVDGDVLPAAPLGPIAAGQGAGVEVLVGYNSEEARLFLAPVGAMDAVDEATALAATAGYGVPPEPTIRQYRHHRPDARPSDLMAAVITDWFWRIPAIRLAEARAAATAATFIAATFVYEFTWRSPSFDGELGACHGVELPFVFDTLDVANTAPRLGASPPQAVADTAHAAWVRFITHGDPGWAPYDTATRTTGLLAETLRVVDDPAGDERSVWDGHR